MFCLSCRSMRNLLLGYLGLTDSKSPYCTTSALQLAEHIGPIVQEVGMDDDVDSRIVGLFGHRDRSSTEDGDLSDILHLEHGIKNTRSDKASGTGEDEMHDDRTAKR
jgi:hypothetical protein